MGSQRRLYTSYPGPQYDGLIPEEVDAAEDYRNNHWVEVWNPVYVTGYFENDSQNNSWSAHQPGENFDRGSNWTAFKSTFEKCPTRVDVRCQYYGNQYGYRGPLIVSDTDYFNAAKYLSFETGASSEDTLLSIGSTAIARVLPTNPASDLPQAVAELLTEGLPSAMGASFLKRKRVSPNEVAGEYLNYTFGVKPFIRDLQAFGRATQRAKQLIDEYARGAGKKIRRRYEFPLAHETTEYEWSNNSGYTCFLQGPNKSNVGNFLKPAYGGWPGTRTDVITRSKKNWFSGAFTYYLPDSSHDFASRLVREEAEMRRLYGGISADTVWNLLPYSWFADWVTNAGDVIHNLAAFARDGLVMPWGYVMERCEVHVVSRVEGAYFGNMVSGNTFNFPDEVSTSYGVVFQRRRKATPFGFGLSESGFTTRQWSILAALGVTKGLR